MTVTDLVEDPADMYDPDWDLPNIQLLWKQSKPEWMRKGMCATVHPSIMYPTAAGMERDALDVCATCPVIEDCYRYAFTNNEYHGVWGGMTEQDRIDVRAGRQPHRFSMEDAA